MNWFKKFSTDYPTLGSLAVVAEFLILTAGLVVNTRLALGKRMPVGYEWYLLFLGACATGTLAAMIGKRMTDWDYAKATNPPPIAPPVAAAATTTTAVTSTTSTTTPVATAPVPDPTTQPPPIPSLARDD